MPVCFNLELLTWKSQDQPAHNVPSELDQPAHDMLSDLDRFSKMIYNVDFYRRNACMF